ncbi:MAG TPA: carbohydrate ABC transporter permease [Solirubrobacteraceae bacterium]|nr:carbohydrate ABC transporter permease [Solirubrobacteraceae bacterium]
MTSATVTARRPSGRAPRGRFRRRVLPTTLRSAVLVIAAAIVIYPVLLILSTALKDPFELAQNPYGLFTDFRFQNIADAWTLGQFGDYFLNTVYITVPTVIGVVALSTIAGYAFAMLDFPFKNLLFYLFTLGLMIPFFSYMVPLYYELRTFGMLGNFSAVILPSIAGAAEAGLPIGIFLMRSFFQDLPKDLGNAARVDGAGEWRVFRSVMLPLALPGAAVLAILAFLRAWNTFIVPLIYLPGEENSTLATGLYQFTSGRTQETELAASAALIMSAPVVVLFLIFQKNFVRGLTSGAVKG